jgi:hypothetical protein
VSQHGEDGRAPESADFAGRIRLPRRRPPLVVLGWVAILGGIVALGLSGRPTQSGATATASKALVTAVGKIADATASPLPPFLQFFTATTPPRFDPGSQTFPASGVVVTSAPGPIALQASRHPSTVYVHGDVFAQQVTWVFVSLQSLDGQVGGWASVSIPGAAGDGRDHRPALRFDVELAIPTGLATGVLVVQANAYNASGSLVASTRVRLTSDI